MANYAYQSSSFSSGGGSADGAFQQADTNRDGRIDFGEFRNFLGQNIGLGSASGSTFETGSFSGGGAGLATYEATSLGAAGSAGFETAAYEASASSSALAAGGAETINAANFDSTSFSSSAAGFANEGGVAIGEGSTNVETISTTQVQQYATDAQGLFKDPNPQIIRRAAAGGVQTYTQNIKIRFLQPPPVAPPGPLIIKEVRPAQPPPPPPLRIRQQAPPLPTPPPLILRERPPQPPPVVASQTVIRTLPPIPVPPRSVIIERLPALPPKPRDIIIERWVPYGAQAKRRTVIQRAAAAKQYPAPRNVIIQYEPVQVRVVREFQRLGVVQANPQTYVQQYGAQLLDASTLLSQARSAGVVEDISPPALAASASFSSTSVAQAAASSGSGFETEAAAFEAASSGGAAGGFSSAFESSGFASGAGIAGFESGYNFGGLSGGFGGTSSSFETSSFSGGIIGNAENAFNAADTNRDGSLDQAEFANFINQNLGGGASFQSASYSSQASY